MDRIEQYLDVFNAHQVPTEFHEQMMELVESGEASEEFAAQLDGNVDWQQAVEKAFIIRFAAIRERFLEPA